MLETFVHDWALRAASLLDGIAVIVVLISAICACLVAVLGLKARNPASVTQVRGWFSRWLALALELLIGSDIIRTAVSPNWTELGQLAATIVMRIILEITLTYEFRPRSGDGN